MASSTLRVAILVNHPPFSTFWPEVKQAFVDSFNIIAPHAQLDFYDPIEKQEYPNTSQYDLVILSGGKADASASDPWILTMLDFIRTTTLKTPKTKMLGICWGHQAMARAFGGHVAEVPSGPIAGLVRVGLTSDGRKFFPFAAEKGSYFHVREVATPADSFVSLAEDNECFVSSTNTMLSFQAHPEIDGAFSKKILLADDTTYTRYKTQEDVNGLIEKSGDHQDGLDLLRRVVQWIDER